MPREALLAALVMSLMCTSLIIGFINLAANDKFPTDLFGTNDIEGALYYQGGNMISTGMSFSEQNYSVANGIDPNTSITMFGHWEQDDAGIHTVNTEKNLIVLDNLQPTGSVYTVIYNVNNTANVPFFLYPRYRDQLGVFGQAGGYDIDNLRVVFDQTGVHVKEYPPDIWGNAGDLYFYPLPNAQNTLPGRSVITTTLDNRVDSETTADFDNYGRLTVESGSTLMVNKDGVDLFSINVPSYFRNYKYYYGGYGSEYAGFNMFSVNANFFVAGGSTSKHYLTWLDQSVGQIIDFYNSVTNFIGSLGAFLGYSISSSLCPWWLSSIIIVPQIVAIAYMIAELFRGD
jgi:hypothetical protein